jgi:hypothetical protein
MNQAERHAESEKYRDEQAGQTKHTPGPWYVANGKDDRYIRHEYSDLCVARIEDGGHAVLRNQIPQPQQSANARLIAAAPALYAALKRAVATMEMMHGSNAEPSDLTAINIARAAIDEAEGYDSYTPEVA